MKYRSALTLILITALPFAFARLIQLTGDFACIGLLAQLGTSMLAACGLIIACQTLIVVPLSSILNAMVIIINPLQPQSAGQALRSGWLLSILMSIPTVTFFCFSDSILTLFDQPAGLVKIVGEYLPIYALSIPFYFALFANQQFAIAIKKPMIAFFSTLLNVTLTLLLAYGFIFGKFGLPSFNAKGLALATIIATALTFLLTTLYFRLQKNIFYHFQIFKCEISTKVLLNLLKTGIPIGIFVATEILAMSVAAFFVGLLGQDALAAQQAASAYLYIFTSLLIAGSQTATANIRNMLWQKKWVDAKLIGNTAIHLWTFFVLTLIINNNFV